MGHKITLENKSKYLALLLRHKPDELGLKMDEKGWVSTATLVDKQAFSFQEILDIVKTDSKGRYEMSPDWSKIRAVSGHSIPWIIPDLTEAVEVPVELYHGTSNNNWIKIKESGSISKMSRNYVHLTTDKDDALKVGERHGKPGCILVIDSRQMVEDGYKFKIPVGSRYFFSEKDIPVHYVKNILWSSI